MYCKRLLIRSRYPSIFLTRWGLERPCARPGDAHRGLGVAHIAHHRRIWGYYGDDSRLRVAL